MKSDPRNRNEAARNSDLSPREMFKVLTHEHREYILEYLAYRLGSVAVNELAEYIAIKEDELTLAGFERALMGLYHIHLPHLAAAGLISYDSTQETVELRVKVADIHPFLQLTTASSSQVQDD